MDLGARLRRQVVSPHRTSARDCPTTEVRLGEGHWIESLLVRASSVGVGRRESLLSGDDHHGVAESIHRCSSTGGHGPAVPATGGRRVGR